MYNVQLSIIRYDPLLNRFTAVDSWIHLLNCPLTTLHGTLHSTLNSTLYSKLHWTLHCTLHYTLHCAQNAATRFAQNTALSSIGDTALQYKALNCALHNPKTVDCGPCTALLYSPGRHNGPASHHHIWVIILLGKTTRYLLNSKYFETYIVSRRWINRCQDHLKEEKALMI